jgi:hypothetical protein
MAMVNYLVRQKIVTPTAGGRRGRGVQRKFSFGDLVVLKAVTKLLQGGVSVYRLRRALASFREIHPEITPNGMPAAFLVTDGQEVFLRHKTGVLELLATRQFSFAFVIEVDSVRREAAEFAVKNATQPTDRRSKRRKQLKSARAN